MTQSRMLDPMGGGDQPLAEMAQLDGSSSRQAMAKKRIACTPRSSSSCNVRSMVCHVDGTKTIWAARRSLRIDGESITRSAPR